MSSEEVLVRAVFTVVMLSIFGVVIVVPLLWIGAATIHARDRAGVGGALAVLTAAGVMLYVYSLTPIPRMGIGALYAAVPPLQRPLIAIDLALSRSAREEVIGLVTTGSLQRSERYGGYVMPPGAEGLSVYGTVDIVENGCGTAVFFMTLTGFSPDSYAGFEYIPVGCPAVTDPLGSGGGTATPMGDGWYWTEAS